MQDTEKKVRNKLASLNWLYLLSQFGAVLSLLGVLLLFFMLFSFSLPLFLEENAFNPFSFVWAPGESQFGILAMVFSSVLLAFLALLFAFPLALGILCYLSCFSKGSCSFIVQSLIRLMTAIPTVVYGFTALFLLTPFIRSFFSGSGMGLLTAAIVLALLVLPTLLLVLQSSLFGRLHSLELSGLGLGFSKAELFLFFVLPFETKSILSALLLAFGRALGDTMLPLMLAGNAAQVPGDFLESVRTLTAHIALIAANEAGGKAYASLFAAGAFLFCINAFISLFVQRVRREL